MSRIGSILLLIAASCMAPSQSELLFEYLQTDLALVKEEFPEFIFVISEDGCPACDRAFADLVRTKTETANSLFLITAEGKSINMNGFLEETKNVRHVDRTVRKIGIIDASGIIILNANEIDTILNLTANNLNAQLVQMKTFLDGI